MITLAEAVSTATAARIREVDLWRIRIDAAIRKAAGLGLRSVDVVAPKALSYADCESILNSLPGFGYSLTYSEFEKDVAWRITW